jgi:thiosulfate/3-mercaptopyruvate sulfurtransferase
MKPPIARFAFALFCLLQIGAQAAEPATVVDTAFVAAAIERGAIVWDVRSREEYQRGHLPGAVNLDDVQVVLREAATEDYIPVRDIERLLGQAGIDSEREIVTYGAKAHTAPYFAHITLQWLGAPRSYVYHGGIDDWKSSGRELSTSLAGAAPTVFKAKPSPARLVSTPEVIAFAAQRNAQLLDVRTVREYKGEDIRSLRGGHIPGAVNIPYESNWMDPDTPRKLSRRQVQNKDGMSLKPRSQLAELYSGLDPQKQTIVYCQSGVRASETATILHDLGSRDVKVYDSSWLGYGNTFEAPVEDLSYFNVANVTTMINALQAQIEQLEAELEQLKAARDKRE